MEKKNRKVLVIGLDGASFSHIKRWSDEGRLPTFRRLIEEGVSGKLQTVIPPLTPPAWVSFMTGKNPGKHGIFGFTGKDSNIVNTSYINGETIWSILSKKGKRVVVANVPMTYPVEEVKGIMISGYMAPPDSVYTYPSSFRKELLREISGYRVYMNENDPIGRDERAIESWLNDLYFITRKDAEMLRYFLKSKNWDFFMTVLNGTDWISHVFWRYMDPACYSYDPKFAKKYGEEVVRYYQEIDSILRDTLDQMDKNTLLFVMSDHGNGPLHDVFYVDGWLVEEGLMKKRRKGLFDVSFWISTLKINTNRLIVFMVTHPTLLKLSRGIWNTIKRESSAVSDMDWQKTKAFPGEHGIFINLKGREPNGIVDPEDYEKVRDYIVERLSVYTDPESGDKVFAKVFRKEEVYCGPCLNQAPDIMLLTNSGWQVSRGFFVPRHVLREAMHILPAPLQSSKHEMEGVFLAIGSEVCKGKQINASIMDLTPTILHMFNIDIPSDIDGRVLTELFEPSSQIGRAVRHQVSDADVGEKKKEKRRLPMEEEVKKKLKALGYLD